MPMSTVCSIRDNLMIIDIKRFLTQGSENIKLYTGYAGYSKRFGVLHHHQLNMIDLYESYDQLKIFQVYSLGKSFLGMHFTGHIFLMCK